MLPKYGLKLLYRNFVADQGEVDIVARDGGTLVIVEVRARSASDFGSPAESVGPAKQKRVARAAMAWVRLLDKRRVNLRFDIIEVFLKPGEVPELRHIENAFDLPRSILY